MILKTTKQLQQFIAITLAHDGCKQCVSEAREMLSVLEGNNPALIHFDTDCEHEEPEP